jgi:DNA-binding CsgD family transcriptional regulator
MSGLLKISLQVGMITAGAIIVYEAADQLFLYHFFGYEYYITGIAIAALATGVLLSRKYFKQHAASAQSLTPIDQLTSKEHSILLSICQGKSNKEIAAENFIELSTVKTHINNIYNKLGVKNRKEAVKACENYFAKPKSTLSPPLEI